MFVVQIQMPNHVNAQNYQCRQTKNTIHRNKKLQHIPLHVPRLRPLLQTDAVLVVANQLLLVHAAVLLPIPAGKPPQPVRLVLAQPLAHLRGGKLLRAHKVVEHLALVDVGQHRRNRVGLARQKGVPAAGEDDRGHDHHVEQDEERQRDRHVKRLDRLGARVDLPRLVGRAPDQQKVVAVDGRQTRHQHGEELGHDAAEADEEDEQVAVEQRAHRHVAKRQRRVVEQQRVGGRVPPRQDVVRLHHAHGRLHAAPGHLEEDGEDGDDPRRLVRDDGGRRKQESRDEADEEQDAHNHGDDAAGAEQYRVRILGQVVVVGPLPLLGRHRVRVVGRQRRVAQHVAVVLEPVVDVAVRRRVHVLEVHENVAHHRHGGEPGDAPDVGHEARLARLQQVEEDAAQHGIHAERRRQEA